MGGKPIVVCIEPGYSRQQDVEVQMRLVWRTRMFPVVVAYNMQQAVKDTASALLRR